VPETFGQLLRQLRIEAGLTQEELAEAARLSPRSVSDLERGIHPTARKDTAQLLARALGLTGPAQSAFEAAARGRAPADAVFAGGVASIGAPTDQARALEGIGRTHLNDGQPSQAAPPLRQALAIYQRLRSPHTPRIETLLREHDL
jgi:transcriptional regulator with XRE-family HTH domain